MKKLISTILSMALLISALSVVVSAEETASILLPNDNVSGMITVNDNNDLYYVDFSMLNYDFNISVNVSNAYDVFVELSDGNEILYTASNMSGEAVIELHAADIEPGRYYVNVYGAVYDDSVVSYTLNSSCNASNPGVFEGINLPLNTYKLTRSSESYWKFTLDEDSDLGFLFNAPTNKDFSAVIYNENDVYAYECTTETAYLETHLDAGVYYVRLHVPSIGEDSVQIKICK